MRLSPPHILRGFSLTLCCALLLLAVPVAQGQAPTPTPSPVGQVASAIEQTNTLIQQQGAVVAFALLIIVVVLVIAWVTVRPTIANNTASNTALIQSSNQFMSLSRDFQTSNLASLEVSRSAATAISENTHTLIIMNKSNEALQQQLKTEREAGVKDVNAHTDEVIERLELKVNGMMEKVDKIIDLVDKRLGRMDGTIQVVLKELRRELVETHEDVQNAKESTSTKLPILPGEDPAPPSAPGISTPA